MITGPRLTIRTPEGIEFSLPLAGPAARMLAMFADLLVTGAASTAAATVLDAVSSLSRDLGAGLVIVANFAIWMGYGMALEWRWSGQTIGKRLLGLRVIDAHGGRLEPAQIVVRNILRLADMLPAFYLLGGCVSLFDGKLRRLGDFAANTVVARANTPAPPALDALLGNRYNSMLEHRRLAALLRERTPPLLAAAALDALLRRDEFDADARVRVFDELAARLRELAVFPPSAIESLASEQYVRNAVEILYRGR